MAQQREQSTTIAAYIAKYLRACACVHLLIAYRTHSFRGKHVIRELGDFLRQEGEERRGTVDMTPEQQADIQAFCEHVPILDIQAEIVVDDEAEIVVGDIATCRITITRKNLKVRAAQRKPL